MRAVQLYAPPPHRDAAVKAVARARDWLASTTGEAAEERAFRLLGLSWAGAGADVMGAAARELLALQRSDGGWSQEPSLESDAYATGSALFALHHAGGLTTDSPAYRAGVVFLLKTQLPDGTWKVKSRSKPFQPYYESGFPHEKDQFVSIAATGWAVAALAAAVEK